MTGKFDSRINQVYQSLVEYTNTEKNPLDAVDKAVKTITQRAEKQGPGRRIMQRVKGPLGNKTADNENKLLDIERERQRTISKELVPHAKNKLKKLKAAVAASKSAEKS